MANEATLLYETDLPVPMTVANGTGIEKGSSLTLSDPYTAALATASGAAVAGIAAEEKIASDGKTKLGVYRRGIFIMTASGAITVGQSVIAQSANKVYAAGLAANNYYILGTALETAADAETLMIELNPYYNRV